MPISFLYPLFLWSLFFLSIPIIIHLFQKKKVVKLQFSTTLFFKSSALKKSKIRRINKILQLIIRLLILLVIILLFSTPIKNDNPFNRLSSKKSKQFCWVDKSLSMDAFINNQTIISLAKEIVNDFDTTLPGELIIFYNNKFLNFNNDFKFKTNVSYNSFKNFYTNFKNLNKDDNNSLLILSDLQTGSDNIFDILKNDEPYLTTIIDLSPNNLNNISVDSLLINNEKNRSINVKLSKTGETKIRSLELISDKMRRGVAQLETNKKSEYFSNFKMSDDIKSGSIRTDNDDDFLHDNQIFFSETPENIKQILIINDNPDFSHLFEAINAIIDSSSFKIIKKTVASLTAEDVEVAEIIVINSLKNVSNIIYSLIQPGFFTDKNILFCPSHSEESSIFNSEILKYLGYSHPKVIFDTTPQFPAKSFSSNYFWNEFKQTDLNQIAFGSLISDIPGIPILKTNKRNSLISKFKDNNNSTWIISSVELEATSNTNLTMSGFYIPLIDKILNQLKISENNSINGYTAGLNFISPIPDPKNIFKVTGDQFNQIFSSPILRIDKPGIYQINNTQGNAITVPVNFDSKELNLSYIEASKSDISKNIKVIKPHKITKFFNEIKHGNFENYLILILLILLLFELYLTISISLYNRNLTQQS